MCGIGGKFGTKDATFKAHALNRLLHRGPDGSGVWESETATLVQTRLAILDLSEAGQQPMVFEEKLKAEKLKAEMNYEEESIQISTYVLVFNGEIYNFRELRRELEEAGETFTSNGDTEVLLRLLVREGSACLPKLAGMFAFAFWDAGTGSALLARDPLGIKPLYYREDAGELFFASESRILTRVADKIDASALLEYFLWGSVPDPLTLKSAVRHLPAGHLLCWQRGSMTTQPWYVYPKEPLGPPNTLKSLAFTRLWKGLSGHALIARVALEESVTRHLISDVPVGIFLSGGIDSTVLLALTREALGPAADIRTFSIGFEDPEFDESTLARRTAEHFGAYHTEWKMTSEEGLAEIPKFLLAADQPGIDGFNTWCVSRLASREGIKVALSGLGGDEIFAGYRSFVRVPQYYRFYRLTGLLRLLIAKLMGISQVSSPYRRLGSFLRGDGSWFHAYHVQRGIFTPEEAFTLTQYFVGTSGKLDWAIFGLPNDPLAVVSKLEITRYMRNQLLRDSDVYSMANGLELRVPFVDARLLESIMQIPTSVRLRQGKQLLIDAMPEIPNWIRNQPKRGFRFPFQRWMNDSFGDGLDLASSVAPIRTNTWYRTWAIASVLKQISQA